VDFPGEAECLLDGMLFKQNYYKGDMLDMTEETVSRNMAEFQRDRYINVMQAVVYGIMLPSI